MNTIVSPVKIRFFTYYAEIVQ